jgi:glycosyltransferase involved in cell wall biosynthesis
MTGTANPTAMRCVVIVPFLNEHEHMDAFLRSLDAQTRRPDLLVLLDDGSTDESPATAKAFAATRDWATVIHRDKRKLGKDRLDGAPEMAAFLWGVDQLTAEWDVLVKMDADLDLAPEHFATVLAALEADPKLGIAGTYLQARDPRGGYRVEPHPRHHVRGPTRFWRRACYEDISPIPIVMGWDGADEVRARARGWTTASVDLPGRPTIHLRPTGAQDGRLRAYRRWGKCAYAVGAHPLGVVAGGALRARDQPVLICGLAYIYGWMLAPFQHVARAPEDIRRATRAEQLARLRSVLRRRS